jgi:hypothetical protein
MSTGYFGFTPIVVNFAPPSIATAEWGEIHPRDPILRANPPRNRDAKFATDESRFPGTGDFQLPRKR